MLSFTRALNFSYFPRSILTLSPHLLLFKFQHCVSRHSLKVSRCRDEDCDDFLPWLEKKAGVQISQVLSIGISDFGRSLFACKSIQAGDCLLKVPFIVQISPDDILPEIKPLVSNTVGTVAKLAVVILAEQKKGQSSEWAPYISCLPHNGELNSTIFWSETELEMIRQSSVYQETINHEAQIRQDYLVIKPVFDHFPNAFEDVQFDSFKHAYGIARTSHKDLHLELDAIFVNCKLSVASRAWESMKGQSLIPFADFLNHDGTSDSVVLCDVKDRVSEVIADRDYAPGEEVLIRYGRFPNSALLLDFGFTVPFNLYDQVVIQVDIPYNDHLRAMKMDILQKHCLSKVKDANFSPYGASFVIKEVRSSRGKGKGIPQSLRAFARILCCNCSQELNDLVVEAAQHDGRLARRPLVNRTLEIRAHEILLSLINKLIEKYDVSIKSLHMLEPRNCRKFAIRQKMAQDLLAGEVRVLRSASAWLKNFCQSYPEQGKNIINLLQVQPKVPSGFNQNQTNLFDGD
ncbi:ribosomal lysine N-methyltransferase 4-like isoform X1 [Chenopodium quinoa]|uniref:ribosomal lysine N-methyltransferase 4-like isoform X1 n=1 Tax=Chenopodium quinoa TaxID=63459 RepID=UPI000B7775C6|nr:ribosomal lysine N-methyltransferase 4-like isoform X1 [Chenopodium quinoa]